MADFNIDVEIDDSDIIAETINILKDDVKRTKKQYLDEATELSDVLLIYLKKNPRNYNFEINSLEDKMKYELLLELFKSKTLMELQNLK